MGKKLSAFLMLAICVAGLAAAGKYADSIGVFTKLPEASYLSGDEEATRPAYRQLDVSLKSRRADSSTSARHIIPPTD